CLFTAISHLTFSTLHPFTTLFRSPRAPEALHPLDLDPRRRLRHHHHRPDAEHPRRPRHRLPVVPAGVGDHPAGPRGRVHPPERGVGAAGLEGSHRLLELALEGHRHPGHGGQEGRVHHRGPHRHAGEPRRRVLEVGERRARGRRRAGGGHASPPAGTASASTPSPSPSSSRTTRATSTTASPASRFITRTPWVF